MQRCAGGRKPARQQAQGETDRADDHAGHAQPGLVDRHGQTEIAELGGSLASQPDVTRFEIAVDESRLMGVSEAF